MKQLSILTTIAVAGLSFVGVWLLALSLAFTPPLLAAAAEGQETIGAPVTAVGWLGFLIGAVVAFYASFPLARFVGRVYPVNLSGKPRWWLISASLALVALVVAVVATRPTLQDQLLQATVLQTVVVVGAATWTFLWQLRHTHALAAPFILYLRRFSSFSDRSVLTALLGATPPGYRAVFLTPLTEAAANFSPMVVAFSGTRLWKPFASCPLPVTARNVEWEDNVEDLARAAACIVIDASDPSPAISREIGILERCASKEKVLWLAEGARADLNIPAEPDRIVRYQRSWSAAMGRIVLELAATGLMAIVLAGLLAEDQGRTALPAWTRVLAAIAFVALVAPVVVQPSVGRNTRRQLRRALRAMLSKQDLRTTTGWRALSRRARDGVLVSAAAAERLACLSQALLHNGLVPVPLSLPLRARARRDAIRHLRTATLVVVDLSSADADVEYLLGVAHGLGRKVVLVSEGAAADSHGAIVHSFDAGSPAAVSELAGLFERVVRDPNDQGPVASLLSHEWVFGERLVWRRVVAFLADGLACSWIAGAYLKWRDMVPAGPIEQVVALYIGAGLLILLLYRFLFFALWGRTPGMVLAGLRLMDADGGPLRTGQALGRSLATYVALVPFAGALAMWFGPRHQTLEDAVSATRVVRS